MTHTAPHSQDTQDTFDPLTKETGIAADDMYRMSGLFMHDFTALSLPTDAHRLFHALLHATCRRLPEWSPDVRQLDEGYQARSVVLRAGVGLLKRNCNSNFQVGIAALTPVGIFDWLEFDHGNEFICWRFKDNVLSTILDQGIYGLLDASGLRNLKNATDYQIFSLASRARRMKTPEFSFTVRHAAIWAEKDSPAWSSVNSRIFCALRHSCDHYGLTALMLLERRGDLRGIDTVTVRFWRPGCCWKMAGLARTPRSTGSTVKCIAIDSSGQVTVQPKAFPALLERLRRARWRVGDVQEA